jgi:hypothetical protein
MDIMYFLVSMSLVCGGISLFVGLRNRAEERRMAQRRRFSRSLVRASVLCLCLGCLPLVAQEVVHAQTGKVVDVNAARKTLTLKLADGSTVNYQDIPSQEPALSFDKSIREKTVPVAAYSKVGSHVVVLYYGYDSPTAIAVKELGVEQPKKSTGSVTSFDHHQHSLTLKTDTAEAKKVVLNEDTIVDTNDGVVKLADYKPSKGDHLRCFTGPDSETALFVAPQ